MCDQPDQTDSNSKKNNEIIVTFDKGKYLSSNYKMLNVKESTFFMLKYLVTEKIDAPKK